MDDMLTIMCEKNKKILNILIKRNLYLLDNSLNIILKKFPEILDFEIKRAYFNTQIKKLKTDRNY